VGRRRDPRRTIHWKEDTRILLGLSHQYELSTARPPATCAHLCPALHAMHTQPLPSTPLHTTPVLAATAPFRTPHHCAFCLPLPSPRCRHLGSAHPWALQQAPTTPSPLHCQTVTKSCCFSRLLFHHTPHSRLPAPTPYKFASSGLPAPVASPCLCHFLSQQPSTSTLTHFARASACLSR